MQIYMCTCGKRIFFMITKYFAKFKTIYFSKCETKYSAKYKVKYFTKFRNIWTWNLTLQVHLKTIVFTKWSKIQHLATFLAEFKTNKFAKFRKFHEKKKYSSKILGVGDYKGEKWNEWVFHINKFSNRQVLPKLTGSPSIYTNKRQYLHQYLFFIQK